MAWLSGWDNRKQIDIQDTNLANDLTDYPAYIAISNDSDMSNAAADGSDIRFTQSDGTTLLKYERESWSGGGGSAASADIWTKVPSVAASGGATIYIYWGNSGAADGEDAANVWDANYLYVDHRADGTNTVGTNLTNNVSAAGTSGIVDKGQEYDGTDDYCEGSISNNADALTREVWLYFDEMLAVEVNRFVSMFDSSDSSLRHDGANSIGQLHSFISIGGTLDHLRSSALDIIGDVWEYAVDLWDGTYHKMLLNASSEGVNNPAGTMDSTTDIEISSSTEPMDGYLDEIRVSNTARPIGYINLVYYQLTEADNELTWGAVESDGGGGANKGVFFGANF